MSAPRPSRNLTSSPSSGGLLSRWALQLYHQEGCHHNRISAASCYVYRVKTFPIGIYWPAVLPFVISFVVIAIEDIGDITAAAEVRAR